MKKLLSLLLVTAMLLCVFAGCSSNTEQPAESASAAESEEPAPAESAAAAPVDPEEVKKGDELMATEATGEMKAGESLIEYPLYDPEDPLVITQFNPWVSMFDNYGCSDWNDLYCLDEIQEATGVKYEFVCPSMQAATEQFNLMIASGEMTDVFRCADYYTNGVQQAYNEEVIIDLTDMIPEYAPNYYALLMNTNEATIDAVTDGGMFLSMNVLYTDPYSDMGNVIRLDWLNELGLEVPDSFEEFDTVIRAFAAEYDSLKGAFYVDSDGRIDMLNNIFDVGLFDVSGAATSVPFTLTDGVYACDLVSDNYREYLEYFIGLIADGVIDEDFFTTNLSDLEMPASAAKGEYGIWWGQADSIDMPGEMSSDSDFALAPLNYLYNDDGQYTYGSTNTLADNKGYSISSTAPDPEGIVSFFNYFFTEEGYRLANFGVEGEAHYIDENGTYRFTDLILNNPDGAPFMAATILWTFAQAPILQDNGKMLGDTYSKLGLDCIDCWSSREGVVALHEVPKAASLNADETNAISTYTNDICSYAAEQILKFMTGTEELNDSTWAAYCDQLEVLGLSEVLEVYQNAYDEYLSGDRVVVSQQAPPPGGEGGGDMAPPDGEAPPAM